MVVFKMDRQRVKVILCLMMLMPYTETTNGDTFGSDQDLNDIAEKTNKLKINKCCEKNEVMVDSRCTHVTETNTTLWTPVFTDENGVDNVQVKAYEFVIGRPACDTTQIWPVYHLPDSEDKFSRLLRIFCVQFSGIFCHVFVNPLADVSDPIAVSMIRADDGPCHEIRYVGQRGHIYTAEYPRKLHTEDHNLCRLLTGLVLLPSGKLRHYIHHEKHLESLEENKGIGIRPFGRLNDPVPLEEEKEVKEPHFYDYDQGKYCMEKVIITSKNQTAQFALICVPEMNVNWSQADFLMRKLINPLFHIICMICFLIVAIIYFVLPTLRDLHGNIVTTINICLILGQAADLVRIFTQFSSHVSFMVADAILYVSLLAAFFWLNSMGYYIWKTFRSRNVFLRVTDGRKYCYYSCYAWGCTVLMAGLALFAHFMLDTEGPKKNVGRHGAHSFITNGDQETIGWLGIAVFFTPIAFTVIINIFFYVTTLKVINRMNTYGRIHHKLKHNFDMFLLMFLIMTFAWLFLLMSWLSFDGLMYAHIIVNSLQGPLILYVCVFRQKHVTFLLRKSCCYNEPVPTSEWGDEMTQMNGSSY